MNRRVLIGIIVAAAVVIGIASVVSYSGITQSNPPDEETLDEPAVTSGKHYSIKLSEDLEITANP